MTKGQKTGGRQKGTPNKATADVKAAAREYAPGALKRLAYLYENAESEAAQVAACKEILDRAYGKAPQAITGEDGGPIKTRNVTDEDRAVALAAFFAKTKGKRQAV